MKFALAFIATASAMKLEVSLPAGTCVSRSDSDEIFGKIDTNDNGQISKKELNVAITAFLEKSDLEPTTAQMKAFARAARNDAGSDHTLNKKEFNKLANQCAHFIAPDKCNA